jgi:hypothetical protein
LERVENEGASPSQKQADALAAHRHTQVIFLAFSRANMHADLPFHAGEIVKLDLRFWNAGDSTILSSRFGGIIRVVPMNATSYNVWKTFNEQTELKYSGSVMPATHQEKDYQYRTISADKPLTKDEAEGLMANPGTKKLCLLGKVHWQDATGRYETLHFLCLQHEGAGDAEFSIGIGGEQHNSEQILSQ